MPNADSCAQVTSLACSVSTPRSTRLSSVTRNTLMCCRHNGDPTHSSDGSCLSPRVALQQLHLTWTVHHYKLPHAVSEHCAGCAQPTLGMAS